MNLVVVVAVFIGLMLIVGVYAKRRTSRGADEYYLAGRKVSGLVSWATYFSTTYSAFMLIGLVGFSYMFGVGALGFELIYLMGLMLAVFLGPYFYAASRVKGYLTPSQIISDRYRSKVAGFIAAFVYLVFLIPYMSVQLIGPAIVFDRLSSHALPFEVGVLVMAITALLYTLMGGMRGVAWTDLIQGVLFLASALALLLYVFSVAGGFSAFSGLEAKNPELLAVPGGMGKFTFIYFLNLTIPWFFFCISNPQVIQRLFIPKSPKAMGEMIKGFVTVGFIYTVIVVLIGLLARVFIESSMVKPKLGPDYITPTILELSPLPLAILVMVSIMAASISTLDSILLTLSSIVSVDVVQGRYDPVGVGRLSMAVLTFIVVVFALSKPGVIVELSVASSAGLLSVVPSLIAAFKWRRGCGAASILSIAVGALTSALAQILKLSFYGLGAGPLTLLTSTATFIGVSLVTRPPVGSENYVKEVENYVKLHFS